MTLQGGPSSEASCHASLKAVLITVGAVTPHLFVCADPLQWSQSCDPIYVYAVLGYTFSKAHHQHAQVVQDCAHLTMT